MKKIILTTFVLIFLFFSYHSLSLSANENNRAGKWQDYRLNEIKQSENIFAKSIEKILPEPQASLLNGMIFGIQGSIPKDFFESLKRTGVLHIIALSGTNISILINAAFGFLIPLLGRKKAIISAIILIILFILFVGPSPSVVRAGIMGSLALLAGYFGRQYLGLLSLLITVIIMLLLSPKVINDLGFQLSVMATLGIMMVQAKKSQVRDLLAGFKRGGMENLKITLAAQIFTLPILMVNFGQISIISPLTNILIAPVVPAITNLGLLASLSLVLFRPIGVTLLYCLWSLLSYFILVVRLTSLIPFASINVPKIGWTWGIIYYLVLFFIIFRKKVKIMI